ncbi:MAG: DUF4202 domain-containing protein [Bacteroidota bacterium]
MSKFAEAIAQFDALNAEDPNQVIIAGSQHPKELVYARRMSARLDAFQPDASVSLKLAARCQHIQRWKIPRADYAAGSMGYKKWRNALKRFHAQTATQVLERVGYDAATIDAVQGLLKKRGLKSEPDVQALEDVVCLVFLEHYATDFAGKHDEEKVIRILQKTWKKMSVVGHEAALALPLPTPVRALVLRAIHAA